MSAVKLNLEPLKKLSRQLDELEQGRAQVGLFQDTSGRSADAGRINHNPTLGAIHEFGLSYTIRKTKATVVIPQRSFLRMPLTLHLGTIIRAKGADWLYLLRERGAKRVLQFLGAVGEEVVQESFATRGWGAWPSLSPRTIRRKGSSAILIETAQMRKAISYRVI